MFKIIQNTIIIALEGNLSIEEAKAVYNNLQKILPDLKKGFNVLTDLALVESIDSGAYEYIKKAMELLAKHGVSSIVRIIPDPTKDRGFNIMSQFHYPPDVTIHTCKSFEEAYRYLT